MIIRKTLPEENQRVNELFAVGFEMPLEKEPFIACEPGTVTWAAFQDDNKEMMSTLSVTDFQINFDGHSCKMGGMGGAATLPQYRRMGGIRGCFEHSIRDMYDHGYDFSYLYPFSTAYYRKYGYERCITTLQVSVDLGLLRLPAMEGAFCLCEASHPMTDAIRVIDSDWEHRFNMMVRHDPDFYSWTAKVQPARDVNFTYVYFDASNVPKAYTTFHMEMQPDGRNLVCSRFCFTDRAGFQGLMQLFKSLASDHHFVKFTLPSGVGMEYLMPEWSMGAAQWSVHNNAGMVRVINVPEVLRKASYHGSGCLTLEILDAQLPENNGIFTVSFRNGKASSVEAGGTDPDVRLEIPAFSALIAGTMDFSQALQWLPGVEVLTSSVAPWQAFYRKPLMIVDYF